MYHRLFSLLLALVLLVWSPDPSRAAPPDRPGTLARVSQRLRLPARYRLARMRFKRSRIGKAASAAGRRAGQASRFLRGHLTRAADRLELRLGFSPRLAHAFHRARALSPLTLGAFALRRLRQDPVFFAGYGVLTFGISNLQTPLLIAAGVNPVAAAAIRIATGTPVDLGVLLWREHRRLKRSNPDISLRGTLRHVKGEYLEFAEQRRAENRRYMAARQGPGPLGQLAAPLSPR